MQTSVEFVDAAGDDTRGELERLSFVGSDAGDNEEEADEEGGEEERARLDMVVVRKEGREGDLIKRSCLL